MAGHQKLDMLDEKYENSPAKIPISTFNHISTTKSGIEPIELNLSKKNKRQNPYKSEQKIDETHPLILG